MITFFTTAKDFTGKNRIAQLNALQSWKNSLEGVEIILFAESKGANEISERLRITYCPNVRVSRQGTPYVNEMFEVASNIASHSICCFINADIIIYRNFSQNLLRINKLLTSNYLIVGQRKDLDWDQEIDFSHDWETDLSKTVTQKASIHPPRGSDFFAFPKGQYGTGDIPNLLVGRQGWDLWMIYDGRRRKRKVVDISPTTMVIHQNHDYSHRKTYITNLTTEEEALSNYSYLPHGESYIYTLLACNFYFIDGKIKRNFARGDLSRAVIYELSLRKHIPGATLVKKIITKFGLLNFLSQRYSA
ncbi:hypothetical protein [Nodosilinea nodulosa]|uniref:hypothetical protein n=1 Tax=Nodosilinea nodulosa TaxID=416001 RepID=UPI0012D806CE|nr:hypothetical protein [Nodosilinea nodulosa]